MTTFYTDQLAKLQIEKLPLPCVKFKDSHGFLTSWMHLTPECICSVLSYLKEFKQPDCEDQEPNNL